MQLRFASSWAMTLACVVGFDISGRAEGVTEEEFKALKDLVIKQGQRLDQLEQAHERDQKTIEQNEKIQQRYQEEIQRLQQQVQGAQKSETNEQQKAEVATQI